MHHSKIGHSTSGLGHNPNASRSLACQLSPAPDKAAPWALFCHVPGADICSAAKRALLFDHLVGGGEQRGGTVRPSILAVWALMTSSNLVVCMTGKSAGLAPLRMRPV